MDIASIAASLRRSPLGPLLIIVQVALTLAILLNAAGIVQQHVARMRSVSGLDEPNVFTLLNRWVGQPTDAPAQVTRDVALMRTTPGVVAAVSSNSVPLGQRGWGTTIDTRPIDPSRQGNVSRAQMYFFDEHGADALGLTLQQGRWFTAEQIASLRQSDPGLVILTRALADHLFPDGPALGKIIYMNGDRPSTVVGIVDSLQVSSPGNPSVAIERTQFTVIVPQTTAAQFLNNTYIVRTRPRAQQAAMQEVERRLREANPMRVITQLQPFAETRHDAYRTNRALTAILLTVSLLGTGGAIMLNTVLVKSGVPRIDRVWLATGVIMVVLIGQLAVLVPAWRASRVPPALATRAG